MNTARPARSVVVGIDGSQTAIRAAQWAIDEVVNRKVPLRLVHVTPNQIEPSTRASADNERVDLEYGQTVLRIATAAVGATAQPIDVETAILRGDPAAALIAESGYADTVCVGSVGIEGLARAPLGSTATKLALAAKCPVAIIRPYHSAPEPECDWIVFPLNGSADNDHVVSRALEEARLRHAPAFAVGGAHEEIAAWSGRYPGVRIWPGFTRNGVASFLARNAKRIQLVVIGGSDAEQISQLVDPHGTPRCSVLVVHT
jgi:nucleotide-binding universal stress UspA family protein